MKLLVVAYPIRLYIDNVFYHLYHADASVQPIIDAYNGLIDGEYRQKGYKICFLLPKAHRVDSKERGMDSRIKVFDQDIILYGNRTMTQKDIDNGAEDHLDFQMMPEYFNQPNNEIVVCGFHRLNCVQRIFEEFMETGSVVAIDKSLTDYHFEYSVAREWEKLLQESNVREGAI